MNAELTQKLLKRFPVLYQDYDSPMTLTCMCWGFDHGDGWFEIIWQLSLAIEEELGYSWPRKRWYLFKKRFFRSWNKFMSGVIFHTGCGRPMAMDKLAQNVVRPAIEVIKLPWYGWHGFRRAIASNLYALGAHDKVVQRVLRHAKPHVTRSATLKYSIQQCWTRCRKCRRLSKS